MSPAHPKPSLHDGYSYYLITDGLINQVGESKCRSFGKKRFKAFIYDANVQRIENQSVTIMRH